MLALLTVLFVAPLLPFSPVHAQALRPSAIAWQDAYPSALLVAPNPAAPRPSLPATPAEDISASTGLVPNVPFYSQFTDIQSPAWQKVGCGITDLAMLVHYYRPDATVTVNQLLAKGIAAGAYDYDAGWTYQGLIDLGAPYGLTGTWYTLPSDSQTALVRFKALLANGPVILSVHYQFDPQSTIPHLIVVNGIRDGMVYYNDPATTKGTTQIPLADFLKGWKRKVIVIRPAESGNAVALADERTISRRD